MSKLIGLQYFSNYTGILNEKKLNRMASYRLQMRQALLASKSLGLETEVWSINDPIKYQPSWGKNVTACIVGKLSADNKPEIKRMTLQNISFLRKLKEERVPMISLYSDHQLAKPLLRELYTEVISISDLIVVPSNAMKLKIQESTNTQAPITVIHDPWQIKHQTMHDEHKINMNRIKLIWFGSNLNWPYLEKILPSLMKKCSVAEEYEMTILSHPLTIEKSKLIAQNRESAKRRWSFRLVSWDPDNQPDQLTRELRRAEYCLIPSDPTDLLKQGVSHNRLIDSSRSGCITIASPLKSYIELAKTCLLTSDFPWMLDHAIERQVYYRGLFSKPNHQVPFIFSPENNIQEWGRHLKAALNR